MSRASSGDSGLAAYRRLLGYLKPYRLLATITLLSMAADALCMTLFAKEIKPLIDKLFVDRDPRMILWMPIIIVAIFFVRSIAVYITSYGTAYVGRGIVQTMRQQI